MSRSHTNLTTRSMCAAASTMRRTKSPLLSAARLVRLSLVRTTFSVATTIWACSWASDNVRGATGPSRFCGIPNSGSHRPIAFLSQAATYGLGYASQGVVTYPQMYPQEESAAGGPRRTLVEEAHANWLETSICVLDVYGRLRMAPRAGCQFHRKFLRNKSSRLRMSWIPPAIPHART